MKETGQRLLRRRDGHEARVTFEELFFDLVYVFAVTQLSHGLLHHLTPMGVVETVVLWFAVWLGWQYTCWVTNWFDPQSPAIRRLLFAIMTLGLIMASAIPEAFGGRGLIFAAAYVAMQVGRTVIVLWLLPRNHELAPNFRRMLAWLAVAGIFWIAGGLAGHEWRIAFWIVAILIEYGSPMVGFAFPGLGRSRTEDWTIEGGHLAERCQLFVIVALGETVLATGVALADAEVWNAPLILAFLGTFLGTLAMWWIYFGTSSKDASEVIAHSRDPGRLGAYFHYVHVILVGGIIATAVGNDLVVEHPDGHVSQAYLWAMIAGPAIYLAGSAVYKHVVYGRMPASHLGGLVLLALLLPFGTSIGLLALGWLTTAVMLIVGYWDYRIRGGAATEEGTGF